MKKLFILAVAAVAAGCNVIDLNVSGGPQIVGSGKVTTVSRTVTGFKSVSLKGSIDADVTIGSSTDVKVTGDDNLVEHVTTEVKGGTLEISFKGGYSTKNPLKVSIIVPELEGASIAGSGDLGVHDFKGKSLNLSVAGSGDLAADGSVDKLTASIAGSGDMNLKELKATDADVSVNGSGDVSLFASGNLSASVAGSGDIHYQGHPKVSKSVAGSGDVSGD